MRGATAYQVIYADGAKKISTHAPLAGRDPAKIAVGIIFEISTHAPLAGRDISNLRIYDTPRISTHAPLAGRDISNLRIYDTPRISTHAPLAGRDGGILGAARAVCAHFNPRAPCGARLSTPPIPHRSYQFQPTRPLRGATCLMLFPCKIELVFQPTRPLRGATTGGAIAPPIFMISTHAPLAGRDIVRSTAAIRVKNFNPRAPCGARPQQNEPRMSDLKISTHAPLAGRDKTYLRTNP